MSAHCSRISIITSGSEEPAMPPIPVLQFVLTSSSTWLTLGWGVLVVAAAAVPGPNAT